MLVQISTKSESGQSSQKRILLRSVPSRELLFEPVRDTYGSRLAISFGNENKEGKCPFYGIQCYHCDIGEGEGRFNLSLNQDRLLFFEAHYGSSLRNVEHIMIYNSGSVLNRNEMSDETLVRILAYVSALDNCKVASFDSREMYITQGRLDYLIANLSADKRPRVILGVETQNDGIRMEMLRKTMTKETIAKAFKNVSAYESKVGIDVNVLFQPPGVVGSAAIEEAVNTVDYLLELKGRYCVPLDINFHPYYPGRIGMSKFPEHPRAVIEDAVMAIVGINDMLRKHSPESQLFIGWQDEGHDTDQEKRSDELRVWLGKFDRFNKSQDPGVLSTA